MGLCTPSPVISWERLGRSGGASNSGSESSPELGAYSLFIPLLVDLEVGFVYLFIQEDQAIYGFAGDWPGGGKGGTETGDVKPKGEHCFVRRDSSSCKPAETIDGGEIGEESTCFFFEARKAVKVFRRATILSSVSPSPERGSKG